MARYVHASKADESAIRDYINRHFPEDRLLDRLPSELESTRGGIYLAWDGESLAGMATVSISKNQEAHLDYLDPLPDEAGEAWIGYLVEEAAGFGAKVVRCLVPAQSTALHAMLAASDFSVAGRYEVGSLDDVAFEGEPPLDAGPAWAIDRDRLERFFTQHQEEMVAAASCRELRHFGADELSVRFETGGMAVSPQEGAELYAVAVYDLSGKDRLSLEYLWGKPEALASLLHYLSIEAQAWGIKAWCYALPPDTAGKVKSITGVGVGQSWEGVLLQRRVGTPQERHPSLAATPQQ